MDKNVDKNPGLMKVYRLAQDSIIPTRSTRGSAGYDLYAAHDAIIKPGDQACVKTNLVIELPNGCYGRIAGRSSVALKQVHTVAGVIDNDFRGNISIMLQNNGKTDYEIRQFDKIAQLICERHLLPTVVEVLDISTTERMDKGFGSSGR